MTGKPISSAAARISSGVLQALLRAVRTSISDKALDEESPILCVANRLDGCSEHLDAVLLEHTAVVKGEAAVQAVCPPNDSMIASTSSWTMIRSTNSGVTATR